MVLNQIKIICNLNFFIIFILYANQILYCQTNSADTIRTTKGKSNWRNLDVKLESLVNVNCSGGNNGMIEVKIIGGKKPYFIEWSKEGMVISNKEIIDSLKAGVFTINVIDAKNKSKTLTFEIKQPKPLKLTLIDKKNPTCEKELIDGIIKISVKGGVAPYRYEWFLDEVKFIETIVPYHSELSPGNYIIKAIDSDGCIKEIKINLPSIHCN